MIPFYYTISKKGVKKGQFEGLFAFKKGFICQIATIGIGFGDDF